jgi:hypothetical protein
MLLSNLSGVANTLAAGWGVDGVTSFQEGYPLGLVTAVNNIGNYALAGTERPNVVPGCQKAIGGGIYSRLGTLQGAPNNYFNTNCFTSPSNPFTYGNESRTDPQLRTPGVANYDFALYKNTPIHENLNLELRIEAFNLFNRVQFAFASPSNSVGNTQFGEITADANLPRLLQVGGRITF